MTFPRGSYFRGPRLRGSRQRVRRLRGRDRLTGLDRPHPRGPCPLRILEDIVLDIEDVILEVLSIEVHVL